MPWRRYLLTVWVPVLNFGATSNQKIEEAREPLVEMLKSDNLTTRENVLKAFVRDMRPCIQERARSEPRCSRKSNADLPKP